MLAQNQGATCLQFIADWDFGALQPTYSGARGRSFTFQYRDGANHTMDCVDPVQTNIEFICSSNSQQKWDHALAGQDSTCIFHFQVWTQFACV